MRQHRRGSEGFIKTRERVRYHSGLCLAASNKNPTFRTSSKRIHLSPATGSPEIGSLWPVRDPAGPPWNHLFPSMVQPSLALALVFLASCSITRRQRVRKEAKGAHPGVLCTPLQNIPGSPNPNVHPQTPNFIGQALSQDHSYQPRRLENDHF